MDKLKYVLMVDNVLVGEYEMMFHITSYVNNGNLALELMFWEDERWQDFCDVTVNLGMTLAEDEGYVNTNDMPDILEWLVENKLAEKLEEPTQVNFAQYPKVRFNMELIRKHSIQDDSI